MSASTLPTYSQIYSFGDSLSDAGNVSILTAVIGQEPVTPPYYQEHYGSFDGTVFSNGPTWVQNISLALKLGTEAPSLAGGTDFAYGGAETGSTPQNSGNTTTQALSLPTQLSQFTTANPHVSTSSLYTLSIGGNDVYDILANTALTLQQQVTDVAAAVGNEVSFIRQLVVLGAQNFLVLNVPDLGKTPEVTTDQTGIGGPAGDFLASQLSAQYNIALGNQLAILDSSGVSARQVNAYRLIDNAIANPSAYGLTNTATPVWSGNFTSSTSGGLAATTTAAQNKYLFWDHIHPTETGHTAISNLGEAILQAAAPAPIQLAAGAQLYNAAAGSTILSGAGNETIDAAVGAVTVYGAAGTLNFVGGAAASTVSGGSASATIYGGAGGGYYTAGAGGSSLLVSQGASGANTTLTGAAAGERIFGSAAGNDALIAGVGSDTIVGGSTHTTIQGGGAASVFFTQGGATTVFGGTAGGNTVVGGSGAATIDATKGDAIFGGGGALDVTGSLAGADSVLGGSGALTFNGQGGNMLVSGGASTSNIHTGNGAALIFTGSGSTSVTGGTGSLQVELGAGRAAVTEGTGAATYDVVKGAAAGTDMITGYRPGTDSIALFGYQPADVTISSSGGSSLLSLSDGTTIHLVGVANPGTPILG